MVSDKATTEGRRQEAHELILSAGFLLKHESPSGSRYYHLPGRRGGMLRLSDHAMEKPAGVAARLTIHAACTPRSSEKLRRMVAEAVGWYMMNTLDTTHQTRSALNHVLGLLPTVEDVDGTCNV